MSGKRVEGALTTAAGRPALSTAFDTLTAAQDPEAAGIEERRQAEAIAKAINHGDECAATKTDPDTASPPSKLG